MGTSQILSFPSSLTLTFDQGYVPIENHSVDILTSKSLLHKHYNITVYHNCDDGKIFFYISLLKLQRML